MADSSYRPGSLFWEKYIRYHPRSMFPGSNVPRKNEWCFQDDVSHHTNHAVKYLVVEVIPEQLCSPLANQWAQPRYPAALELSYATLHGSCFHLTTVTRQQTNVKGRARTLEFRLATKTPISASEQKSASHPANIIFDFRPRAGTQIIRYRQNGGLACRGPMRRAPRSERC